MDTDTNPKESLEGIFAAIPVAHAMQIRVADYAGGVLTLAAPEAPSLNHIGIAFGGAIECLGTLAGWGLLWLTLDEPDARIVIQHADTTFKAPLRGDLTAVAKLPAMAKWEHFSTQLERHGRARLEIHARIGSGAEPEGALFRGHYAVALKQGG